MKHDIEPLLRESLRTASLGCSKQGALGRIILRFEVFAAHDWPSFHGRAFR